MAIEDYLRDSDDKIDAYERYPELGTGRYKLRAKSHKWHEGDYGPAFLATVEVLESEPVAGGMEGHPKSAPGEFRTFKINGFSDVKAKKRAQGQVKSYVARLFAFNPTDDRPWMSLARKLCNADSPELQAKFHDRVIALEIVVMPPSQADRKPWRRVTFL